MDGAKSAVAHGCALARPLVEVILKIAQRPAGQIRSARHFWLLLLLLAKVTRSAMEWHRKNRRDRFFTSAGFARARRVNAMDGMNKNGMDATTER